MSKKHCPECGRGVSEAGKPITSYYCDNCGKNFEPSACIYGEEARRVREHAPEKKDEDEGWTWQSWYGLIMLVVIVGTAWGGVTDWFKDRKEGRKAEAEQEEEATLAEEKADRVRSLGIPDSVQGIAGLELPNVSFDVGRELSLGGRMWKHERRNPAYEILLASIKGGDVYEAFSKADKLEVGSLWESVYPGATFKDQNSHRHTPNGASAGRVQSATYWEQGGKGSIYMYVFHDGNTLWTITFKGSDEVKGFAEAFMSRVKVL